MVNKTTTPPITSQISEIERLSKCDLSISLAWSITLIRSIIKQVLNFRMISSLKRCKSYKI